MSKSLDVTLARFSPWNFPTKGIAKKGENQQDSDSIDDFGCDSKLRSNSVSFRPSFLVTRTGFNILLLDISALTFFFKKKRKLEPRSTDFFSVLPGLATVIFWAFTVDCRPRIANNAFRQLLPSHLHKFFHLNIVYVHWLRVKPRTTYSDPGNCIKPRQHHVNFSFF